MKKINTKEIYEHFKKGKTPYNEEKHCQMLLDCMTDEKRGTVSSFCVEAMIGESTFYSWCDNNKVFDDLYKFCKMYSREAWEQRGMELKDQVLPIGMINHAFEYWRLIGWSRFGISKNSRIRLNLKHDDTPDKHYSQLLKQASEGDFTAGEIKQLMEAINVGLNTHQVFKLQSEIDQLKSDLATMNENTNGHNSVTNKGIAQKD
jgi:hypothetical protein